MDFPGLGDGQWCRLSRFVKGFAAVRWALKLLTTSSAMTNSPISLNLDTLAASTNTPAAFAGLRGSFLESVVAPSFRGPQFRDARVDQMDDRDEARVNPRSLRVLVVEDEMLIRWSIGETLAHAGHAVVEAEDGATALERVAAAPIDAVILDFRLPDSNDLTLLATIRRRLPDVPVILMTAYGTPDVIQGALDLGVFRVLSKPFEMQHLAEVLLEACGSDADLTRQAAARDMVGAGVVSNPGVSSGAIALRSDPPNAGASTLSQESRDCIRHRSFRPGRGAGPTRHPPLGADYSPRTRKNPLADRWRVRTLRASDMGKSMAGTFPRQPPPDGMPAIQWHIRVFPMRRAPGTSTSTENGSRGGCRGRSGRRCAD